MTKAVQQKRADALKQSRLFADYLVAAGACDETTILSALARQRNLQSKGYDALVGEILLESGNISKKDLENAILQQDIDRLASCHLFLTLPREIVSDILFNSKVINVIAGQRIYRQGEPSSDAIIVLSGTVSLVHVTDEGKETEVAIVQAGEQFGEMSLLTGEPRFDSAMVVEDGKIVVIARDYFLSVYQQYPAISQAAIHKWFTTIVSEKLQDQAQQEKQLRELLTSREAKPCLQLTGSSKRCKKQRQKMLELAMAGDHVSLLGENGVLKKRFAQAIHEKGCDSEGPFIVFNPQSIPLFIENLLSDFNTADNQQELVQVAALFGLDSSTPFAGGAGWQGYIKLANNGTLVIHNASYLCPKAQRFLSNYMQDGLFYSLGGQKPNQAGTRIILIDVDDKRLVRQLQPILSAKTIHLTSLRDRKKDLEDIVEQFLTVLLEGKSATATKEIEPEAMNKIMAYDWPGNFHELEEALERAVNLTKGPLITANEVFIGQVPITGKVAVNLLSLTPIRNFFQSPFYPKLPQIIIAILFLVVVLLGLFGSPAPESNISLLLIWANWEPLLILSCLLLARIWCSFCPIGFIAELVQKLKIKRIKLSPRILDYGFYVSAIGLAIVFWSQAALDMWEEPAATAGLLLAILFSALLFAILFDGRIWCRYICPLGQMVATFARTSVIEVRSNYNYCSHQCRTYECYTGKGDIEGCRMVKGPFALTSNHNCTLCGNCLKACPHKSVRINLRPPGWELWNSQSADLVVIIFVPLLWGTQIFRGMLTNEFTVGLIEWTASTNIAYGILMILSILFSYHVAVAGIAFIGKIDTSAGAKFGTTFILAMLPLVYANEVAIRLVYLLNHAAKFFTVFGNQISYDFPDIAFRLDLQSIHFLQIILILVGLALSLFVANHLTKNLAPDRVAPAFFRHLPLFVMAVVSILLF